MASVQIRMQRVHRFRFMSAEGDDADGAFSFAVE
jgi:hypothetical protein